TRALAPRAISPQFLQNRLPPVPPQVPPITIYVAVLAPEFSALVPRRAVVFTVQIAAKLPPIMSDLGLVVPDVAPLPPAIIGKHGSRAQSHQQKHSRNRPFHIFGPPPRPADSIEWKPDDRSGVAEARIDSAVFPQATFLGSIRPLRSTDRAVRLTLFKL